ncbi:MAG: sugar phosphate isomerase/epimerase [Clostridiales bacterium]|nr:sugar phosphate isomerase/epimerase [Clostridiales bacterium]
MFDIKIGTMIPGMSADKMIPQLNPKGFESYELHFENWNCEMDYNEHSKRVLDAADGRAISVLGHYGNTITDEKIRRGIELLIDNAHLYNCNTIGVFAGGCPDKSVPDTIPEFKKVFDELCRRAEANGVRLALEGCGGGWWGGSHNIAFCSRAWELIFDAVTSDALGLEWEPAHAIETLAEPIPQLRKWAKKVFHVHGKDGHVDRDIIAEHGIIGIMPYAYDRSPGFGDTNWVDIFTILMQNGFKGSCDIEGYHDPVYYDDLEWSSQLASLDYLKRCRGGVEFFDGPTEYRGWRHRK